MPANVPNPVLKRCQPTEMSDVTSSSPSNPVSDDPEINDLTRRFEEALRQIPRFPDRVVEDDSEHPPLPCLEKFSSIPGCFNFFYMPFLTNDEECQLTECFLNRIEVDPRTGLVALCASMSIKRTGQALLEKWSGVICWNPEVEFDAVRTRDHAEQLLRTSDYDTWVHDSSQSAAAASDRDFMLRLLRKECVVFVVPVAGPRGVAWLDEPFDHKVENKVYHKLAIIEHDGGKLGHGRIACWAFAEDFSALKLEPSVLNHLELYYPQHIAFIPSTSGHKFGGHLVVADGANEKLRFINPSTWTESAELVLGTGSSNWPWRIGVPPDPAATFIVVACDNDLLKIHLDSEPRAEDLGSIYPQTYRGGHDVSLSFDSRMTLWSRTTLPNNGYCYHIIPSGCLFADGMFSRNPAQGIDCGLQVDLCALTERIEFDIARDRAYLMCKDNLYLGVELSKMIKSANKR